MFKHTIQLDIKEKKQIGYIKIDINKNNIINSEKSKSPFFNVSNEDNKVVKSFISAIKENGLNEANMYVSKHLKAIGGINIDELKQIFGNGNGNNNYKYLDELSYYTTAKIRKNSVLVIENEKMNSIIHLYMVREPDSYGSWKICGIEKE